MCSRKLARVPTIACPRVPPLKADGSGRNSKVRRMLKLASIPALKTRAHLGATPAQTNVVGYNIRVGCEHWCTSISLRGRLLLSACTCTRIDERSSGAAVHSTLMCSVHQTTLCTFCLLYTSPSPRDGLL